MRVCVCVCLFVCVCMCVCVCIKPYFGDDSYEWNKKSTLEIISLIIFAIYGNVIDWLWMLFQGWWVHLAHVSMTRRMNNSFSIYVIIYIYNHYIYDFFMLKNCISLSLLTKKMLVWWTSSTFRIIANLIKTSSQVHVKKLYKHEKNT